MSLSVIFSQMAMLFIVVAVGFAANKFNIITADSSKLLSKLVLNIAMPCTILSSVLGGNATASGSDAVVFLLLAFAFFALMFLVSVPIPKLLHAPREDRGLYRFMTVFGNVGFMGFPIITTLFGAGAAFYVTLFNIAFSLLCFSAGILLVSGGHGGKINFRLLINPTMIVSILTVIIFYTKPLVPAIINDTVGLISQLTTPTAMLVIGSTLAVVPFREVFSEWRLYPLTLLKLIAVPVVVFFLLRLVTSDPLTLGVLTVLSAMPVASNATMLSLEYGGNEKLASKGVFITTLISVITIPLIVSLLLS